MPSPEESQDASDLESAEDIRHCFVCGGDGVPAHSFKPIMYCDKCEVLWRTELILPRAPVEYTVYKSEFELEHTAVKLIDHSKEYVCSPA